MLTHIGLDCAGAVQLCLPDEIASAAPRVGTLRQLSDSDISDRLVALRRDAATSWLAPRERWSLAGVQAKFTLRREDETWYEATGAEPSTHIVKRGVDDFRMQALNEHISLQTASRVGLSAARSRMVQFGSESALVVERYDRRRAASAPLARLHQEDLCQAAGVYPAAKYESDGGPRAVDILELLRSASRREHRQRNVDAFVDALALNVLIHAPDAHAKNYSLMLLDDTVLLAPLYDVASGAPYDAAASPGLLESAMMIGRRREFAQIDAHRWAQFAKGPDWIPRQLWLVWSTLPSGSPMRCQLPSPRRCTHALPTLTSCVPACSIRSRGPAP